MSVHRPKPPGFPLPPIDIEGRSLEQGDLVTIVTIPAWLTNNLPEEEIVALRAVEGTKRNVLRFDEHGYAWFGDHEANEWFCLRPDDVKRSAR